MIPNNVALSLALAGLVGAVLGVERRAQAQLMLSRPIVAGPLAAGVLGEPLIGLALGVSLELFFLSTAFHGASTPDQETWTTVLGATIAAGALRPDTACPATLALATACALPFARLGRHLESAWDRDNERLLERATMDLDSGNTRRSSLRGLSGLTAPALSGAFIAIIGVLVGPWVGRLGPQSGASLHSGLELGWWLFTGLCAARAIRFVHHTRKEALLAILAALGVASALALSFAMK